MAALCCHLLFGSPASGKTTAGLLAPMLQAKVFSTDRIREELYGDAAIHCHWPEAEARLYAAIRQAVAASKSVLIDATHTQRTWRLALTQRLELAATVELIGWWLRTPLAGCLAWNQQWPRSSQS
jgi:predicted kinase